MTARRFVLSLSWIGLALALALCLRLGAVIAATPPRLWLSDYPGVDVSVPPSPSTGRLADWLSGFVSDPALFQARAAACGYLNQPQPELPPAATVAKCLAVVDDALRSNPASGGLWLFRAEVLLNSGESGDSLSAALRHSYEVSPREGWIAGERVLFGLRLYPVLRPDLQAHVVSDLILVLADIRLAQPLIDAYPSDSLMRASGREALLALPPDLLERFVGWVKTDRP
jgi:hypothetical protein